MSSLSLAGAAPNALNRLPLGFEPAGAQQGAEARFTARGTRYEIRLRDDGVALRGRSGESVAIEWLGERRESGWTTIDRQRGVTHYLRGRDRAKWRRWTPRFGRVRQENVFAGVDVEHYGAEGRLEFDFVVQPDADPGVIAFAVKGADRLRVDEVGDLVMETAAGEIRTLKPVAYQEADGERLAVAAEYVIEGERVRFKLGDYDEELTLVIDPVVEFATYLGGDDDDGATDVAIAPDGFIYVTGFAEFAEEQEPFPSTPGSFQPEHGGESMNQLGGQEGEDPGLDAFVMKLTPDGSEIVYATFYGTSEREEGQAIDVDADGAAYIAGLAVSQGLPTSPGAYRASRPAGTGLAAFAAKFSPDGSQLVWGTYLGGSGLDRADGIAADGNGGAIVVGATSSTNFGITTGAAQRGRIDAFVLHLLPDGTDVAFSTVLSGSLDDRAQGVRLDENGAIYVTGFSDSTDFPTTTGAFQEANAGGEDAFVAKLSADGATVAWSTLLGGGADDGAYAVALGADGSATIVGVTESTDLAVGEDALQDANAGGKDLLIATVSSDGSEANCTYLGGAGNDEAQDGALSAQGDLLLTGQTSSQDYPTTPDATQGTLLSTVGDAFFTRISPAGVITESTFFGSSNEDTGRGIAVGPDGGVVIVGVSNFEAGPRRPLRTTGAIQPRGVEDNEGFVVKFEGVAATPPFVSVSAASFVRDVAVAAESLASGFGEGLAGEIASATSVPLPTTLAGVRVLVVDSAGIERAAELIFVSTGQINYIVPAGTAPGPATVRVERDGEVVAEGALSIATAAPSLFTANASGEGVAAAVVVQASGGVQTSFNAFSADLPGSRTPVPINLGNEGDVTVLIVFGTGFRGAAEVTARIGDTDIPVLFAGAQGEFVGLDQANIELLRELIGSGVVEIVFIADGVEANRVTLAIE